MNKPFTLTADAAFLKNQTKKLLKNQIRNLLLLTLSFSPPAIQAQCWDWTCFENKEIKMNADCEAVGYSGGLLVNPTACIWGGHEITFFDPISNAELGNILDVEYLDQTLTYRAYNTWTHDECFGTVTVVDERGPDIACENINVPCTENYNPISIGAPAAVDNCTYATGLASTDEVIDFGCGETGFTGYFSPENWELCILGSSGDGGVDVTGAPGSISVEGADNSPISDNCPYLTRFKIELPTAGYVTFDWSSFGGSAFDHENTFFTVGDTCVLLTIDSLTSGSYTSWLIEPGTWISFEVSSNGDADNMTAVFENFHFVTPAIKVIHRTWSAVDAYGNAGSCTQVITLERALLDDVQFPENRDGVEAPLLECGASTNPTFTEPEFTGYPFTDADGDLSTTDDQSQFIGSNECLIDVFYNDIIFPECDGNYNIARTWTVYDQCTDHTREEVQIIRVADTTPPEISCPEDITVSTDFNDCSATFTVPEFSALDLCSDVITYSSAWNFGSGNTVYENIPTGIHTLTLSATDGCDNTAECTLNVTVEDQVQPTVICDAVTAAAITSDGTSIVFAESLDDGSYDACCAYANLDFAVKPAGAPDSEYAPTLSFACDMVGFGEIPVNMRVTDCNGNSNFCTVAVTVQDNEAPTIACPADMTVDCGTDLDDMSLFGELSASDNCYYNVAETVSHDLNTCGVGTFTRHFMVFDAVGNISECTQNVSIENLTPWNADGNQINFPPDFTVEGTCGENLHPDNLSAPFDYPTYNDVDGCAQPARNFEDEIFYLSEPACYYLVRTWSIMDWCGDGTVYTANQTITVNDNTAPVFTYPQTDISIELNGANNCTATFMLNQPEVTDCSQDIEVYISGDLGNSFGTFTDVAAGTYAILYTATDGCGNSATNEFTVSVIDNTVPTLNCPSDMTADCGTDFSDLSVFGAPTVTESCDADTYTVSESVESNINNCGTGFYKRTWTITDENGNTSICEQFIYVENQSPWTPGDNNVNFPADFALNGNCGGGTNPEDLPMENGFPTWENNEGSCADISASYEDETEMIAPPLCYQINRTWTLSDACNPGIAWTHVQVITVEDNDAPVFLNPPSNQNFAPTTPGTCTAEVIIEVPEIEECDPTAEIVMTGDLDAGFGTYDLTTGVYDITFTATDGCGNSSTHSYQITIEDNIPPAPICLSGLTLDIPMSQQLEVNAATFNAASNDNCSSFNNLNFSYSADADDQTMVFNCEDLGSTISISLFVTDEAGNQASCNTNLQITDDENHCGGEPPAVAPDIYGAVYTWQSEPVVGVEITLQGTGIAPASTGVAGNFEFLDMTQGNTYTAVPQKDINHLNGVTTIDAYMVSDHISGIEALDNGYQHVAGDVDNSQSLSEADVTAIEDLILFNTDAFAGNTSWRFTEMSYVFPGGDPLSQAFPESVSINDLQEDETVYFIGIKTGDLNGTANPQNFNNDEGEDREGDDLVLSTKDIILVPGTDYEVSFEANLQDFVAGQFTLDFNSEALQVNLVNPVTEHVKFGESKLSEGALNGLWINRNHDTYDEAVTLFKISFTALQEGNLSDYLALNSRFTPALSYRKNREEQGVLLSFTSPDENAEPVIEDFTLHAARPNPFARQTFLEFDVPSTSEVIFTFYSAGGIEIFRSSNTYEPGTHRLEVTAEDLDLPSDALILYNMQSGDFRASGKLIWAQQ